MEADTSQHGTYPQALRQTPPCAAADTSMRSYRRSLRIAKSPFVGIAQTAKRL
ncbi:MAG: hypothetical protein SPJ21_06075 [Prevotella sp.]|nr:hypothetical protein [Prevotella sp.]